MYYWLLNSGMRRCWLAECGILGVELQFCQCNQIGKKDALSDRISILYSAAFEPTHLPPTHTHIHWATDITATTLSQTNKGNERGKNAPFEGSFQKVLKDFG